jgi:hypothetical protein
VDITDSGSYPMAGFGISGVEPWGHTTIVSANLVGLCEVAVLISGNVPHNAVEF